MGDIKDTNLFPYTYVLIVNACIFDGHIESGERNDPGAELLVKFCESRIFHRNPLLNLKITANKQILWEILLRNISKLLIRNLPAEF
jgi:hypothetical protein